LIAYHARRLRLMLGKTAGGIYWLFRYLERAENIARLVETGHRFTLTRGSGSAGEWRSIVQALGMDTAYRARHGEYESGHVVNFLLREKGNDASLRAVIDMARQNARATRTAITREVWEAVNESWIHVTDAMKRPVREAELPNILEMIKRDSAMVRGAMHNTMLRNDVYNFARIGNFIERADNTARLLDVKYYVLLPSVSFVGSSLDNVQWEAILRSTSAYSVYRWLYPGRTTAIGIAEFLIRDQRFPRSLAFSYSKLRDNLRYLSQDYAAPSASLAATEKLYMRLQETSAAKIFEDGLHEFLVDFLGTNRTIGALVEQDYRFTA
jgi:uncharacterized alpha-E superfamily protein